MIYLGIIQKKSINNNNNDIKIDKINKSKSEILNYEKNINNKNNQNQNQDKLSDKLQFHGEMCMNDLFNSEITLNIYSVRLQNNIKEKDYSEIEIEKEKDNLSDKIVQKEFFMKKLDLPDIAVNRFRRKSKQTKMQHKNKYNLPKFFN